MPFDIKLQYDDYKKWAPGSRLAGTEYRNLLTAFSRKIANLYVEELVKAIESQRYKGRWEPLSPDYLKYKQEKGLSTKIWEATSLLKDSILVYRSGNSYVVGVNRNLKYPDSSVYVYEVIRWMEFGTSRMPARPLFTPVKRRIERNIRTLWEEFLEERGFI